MYKKKWLVGFMLLKKIIIENGITKVGSQIFEKCYRVEDVEIAGSVKSVGSWAFLWCGMKKVILGEGVEELEDDNETYKSVKGVVYTKDGNNGGNNGEKV